MTIDTKRMIRTAISAATGCAAGFLLTILPTVRSAPSLPVIAFIPRTSGTNLTEDMHRGAMAAAKDAGYQIYWNAPTREDDLDRQILLVESAVRRGAKAIILGPTNPWGVTSLIKELESRKVPVIVVQTESPVPTGPYLTSVTPDQTQFGKIAANRVIQITGGSGEIAIVGLDRGMPETLVRTRGFMQAMAAYGGIKVVAQSPGSVQTLQAEQSAREIVGAYPNLKAIFAVSADATQGAMIALQDMDPKHAIALVGCDRDLFLVDSLLAGRIDSIVAADGFQIGNLAVKAALSGMEGHALPPPEHVNAALLTRGRIQMIDNH